MTHALTLGTLFSGCDCVGVGFLAAGFSILWHCEWDKRPSAVLRYRFPGIPNFGDVATFPADSVQLPDVVWMSPPCQDLSIIGGKAGLDGEKSKYFFDAGCCHIGSPVSMAQISQLLWLMLSPLIRFLSCGQRPKSRSTMNTLTGLSLVTGSLNRIGTH